MDLTSRWASIPSALLLCLPLTSTVPTTIAPARSLVVAGSQQVRVDLRAAPLPAGEPELAREALTCNLGDAGLCDELTTRLLALPFAWHRTGYTVELADGADAPSRAGREVAGLARARSREVVVFVHRADTVNDPDIAFPDVHRTLAHELGHVMHQTCGEEDVLEAWRIARDLPEHVPLHGHGEGAYASVSEDLAESAMSWLTDGAFAIRSALERARFRPGRPERGDAAHHGGG